MVVTDGDMKVSSQWQIDSSTEKSEKQRGKGEWKVLKTGEQCMW